MAKGLCNKSFNLPNPRNLPDRHHRYLQITIHFLAWLRAYLDEIRFDICAWFTGASWSSEVGDLERPSLLCSQFASGDDSKPPPSPASPQHTTSHRTFHGCIFCYCPCGWTLTIGGKIRSRDAGFSRASMVCFIFLFLLLAFASRMIRLARGNRRKLHLPRLWASSL